MNSLFIATELEWFPSQLHESEEFYKRNTADFREITVSKLKIKVEIKIDFLFVIINMNINIFRFLVL